MIQYIDGLLTRWARWCALREDGGLGFPKQVSFVRLGGGSNPGPLVPMVDEEAMLIDHCVARLEEKLYDCIDMVYRGPDRPVAWVAERLGCSRDTVYSRMHQAHNDIMGWMQDVEAGVMLPSPKIRNVSRVALDKRSDTMHTFQQGCVVASTRA